LRWESWLESLADAYHVERERADKAEEALRLLASAAASLARLPYPVSADERTDWLTYQQRLKDVLAARPSQGTPERSET
jgi:plasmid stabilization system protein ParE